LSRFCKIAHEIGHSRKKAQKAQRGTAATEVAQNCILLYRGFVIRWPQPAAKTWIVPAACRMQFGDTADYKSALPPRNAIRKNCARKQDFHRSLCKKRKKKFLFCAFCAFLR